MNLNLIYYNLKFLSNAYVLICDAKTSVGLDIAQQCLNFIAEHKNHKVQVPLVHTAVLMCML